MSAFLKSWLPGYSSSITTAVPTEKDLESEVSLSVSQHEEDGEDSDGGSDRSDTPPAFPAPNSAQRLTTPSASSSLKSSSNGSALPKVLSNSQLMPPPPLPSKALRLPGVASSSASSMLSVPSIGGGGGSTLGLPPSTNKPPVKKSREKVALAPGFGPLDWAALKSSGSDLRGVDSLLRVTPSMLKEHNKKEDAWSAFNGKVYNITPYLPYHPGGEKELMRVAGRDGSKLFALTHSWVNVDFMLDACLVGFLVPESYSS